MKHFECEGELTLQKMYDWWDKEFPSGDYDDEIPMSRKRHDEYFEIMTGMNITNPLVLSQETKTIFKFRDSKVVIKDEQV